MKKNYFLSEIAAMIDHSLLHPCLRDDEIKSGCVFAGENQVKSVCVKPYSVKTAKSVLKETKTLVSSVVGFPHGNTSIAIKSDEAKEILSNGGTEIDMVVNIGKVLSNDWKYVSDEICAINQLVISEKGILKVIFETGYLSLDHIIRLCQICSEESVAFVKTSTGYGFVKESSGFFTCQGSRDDHLKLMRQHCSSYVEIKAAGGIRTLDDVLRVKKFGVTRIGTTSTEQILKEAKGFLS